ncbi:MAG: 50S ribosomal protein L29 [Desulfovibrionaceae bacterium]|nr:50S ribosomal protein L29 [Desulfovibrionaceae bacterium]
MTGKELRALNDAQLVEKLAEFRRELFNLRFQHATAQLENTQRIPEVKRTVARILTVQRERQGA